MADALQLSTAFLETFEGSARELFRAWLSKRPATTKWIIAADFALRDKTRANDCFAFSIIPYETAYERYKSLISKRLPKDLKKSRTLTEDSAELLSDGHAFHVVVPINRDRVFFHSPDESELAVARKSLEALLETFTELERGPDAIRKLRAAVQKARAKAFNVALLTDLTILGILLPIITLLISRERLPSVMGWYCDRDNMTNWNDGLLWNIALENLHGLAEKHQVALGCEPNIGVPDLSSGKEVMWFDHLIRQPDWFAGTLATWHWQTNTLSSPAEKYRQVVENVLADAENIVVLPISMLPETVGVSRLLIASDAGGPETHLPEPDRSL